MYLHIGNEMVIPCEEIIAILNLGTTGGTGDAGKKDARGESFKSCIITDNKVYYSTISSGTLMKRAGSIFSNLEQE